MKLVCQEVLLPGKDLAAKWCFAREAGFDGIELLGETTFAERLPEILASGGVFPSICVVARTSIVDYDPERRRAAIEQMKSLLSAIPEIGGRGVVSPAGIGLIRSIPRFTPPPRTPAEDRELLIEALAELGDHAERMGAEVFLEPLNRYEDHILRRLEQAVELCQTVGSPALRVMADTFHMAIEEDDLSEAIRRAGPWLGHVHLADSNRFQPGEGHTDFRAIFSALKETGFAGAMALECSLRGEADTALRATAHRLRELGATLR